MPPLSRKHILHIVAVVALAVIFVIGYLWVEAKFGVISYSRDIGTTTAQTNASSTKETKDEIPVWPQKLDTAEYDKRILALADYVPPAPIAVISTTSGPNGTVITKTSTTTPPSLLRYSSTTNVTIEGKQWPPKTIYPNGGAVLPFKRILAYYGNFYSRQMGILGELTPKEVLSHLAATQALWEEADPTTPVLPAIEYIAMVAQAGAGADGMYRAVMPDAEIEKAYALAQEIKGVMILDIQVGLSPLTAELPKFKKYLERPDVFFALDPEFSMKTGDKPGTVIGTFNANDINYTIDYMAKIVRDNHLPPKVLLVHRFTTNMVTGALNIKPQPEVQVVMVMDGWGPKENKRGTYSRVIVPEPVQFTGVKLFYKNDLKPPSSGLLSPKEVLDLHPKPIYIQYQ